MSWTVLLFIMAGQFLAAWWPQTLGKRISAELPATGNFPDFFSTCFDIWTWNLVYTSGRWHDTSSLSFITIRRVLQTFSLSVLRLESWLIHSVGCTTYWVDVSPDWGPYDLLHVLSLGTGNKVWWLCLVPTSTTRFASDVGYRMAKIKHSCTRKIFFMNNDI